MLFNDTEQPYIGQYVSVRTPQKCPYQFDLRTGGKKGGGGLIQFYLWGLQKYSYGFNKFYL